MIVEDHALTRTGLRTALDADPQIEVVGEAADGLEGLRLVKELLPDVVVLDIGLPGIDGIELAGRLRASALPTHIVMLTIQSLRSEVLAALAAGADGYCVKASDPSGVITAVKTAGSGGAYFDPQIAHVVLRALGSAGNAVPPKESPLSPREREILALIADGAGNQEIAERCHLSLGTVKDHVRAILKKMSARDRTQAAVNALRRGLL